MNADFTKIFLGKYIGNYGYSFSEYSYMGKIVDSQSIEWSYIATFIPEGEPNNIMLVLTISAKHPQKEKSKIKTIKKIFQYSNNINNDIIDYFNAQSPMKMFEK